MKKLMFSKMLKELGIEDVAKYACQLGFDGIDLTCRSGGHVEPEEVKEKLPKAVKLFNEKGLEVPMITTNIVSANEKWAKETFEAAGGCKIKYIKLGYWWIEEFGETRKTLNRMRCDLDGIEKLAKENGVCAMVHIHGGSCINSNSALLWQLLMDRDTRYIGAYIDPGHMAEEGGRYGWIMGIELLEPYIKMVAVKNFKFIGKDGEKCTEWAAKLCPLKEGIVPYPGVFEILKKINYDGYLSIASEYLTQSSWKILNVQERIEQTMEDMEYLESLI